MKTSDLPYVARSRRMPHKKPETTTNAKTAQTTTRIFNMLWEIAGPKLFVKLFSVIHTDNGTEFSDPGMIENYRPDPVPQPDADAQIANSALPRSVGGLYQIHGPCGKITPKFPPAR